VEIATAPDEPEPPPEPPPAGEEQLAECGGRFVITRLEKSSPGCTVDVPDEGSQAVLECEGNRVVLRFDTKAYEGTVTRGELALALVSTYDFTDGCQWQGSARVAGSPRTGLELAYEEMPIRGAECSQACTAKARIELSK
jgi:hypothetical protein